MSGGASHGVTPHTVCAATGNAWPPAHSLVSYMHMVVRVGELVMQKGGGYAWKVGNRGWRREEMGSDMRVTHMGVAAHASRTTTSTQSPHIHADTSGVVRVDGAVGAYVMVWV